MVKGLIHSQECRCFTWSPVIAGALTALGFSFLLNLFGVAIGLTAFTTNNQGLETLSLGGLIATGLGVIVSMFAAGWLSGYLGNRYCSKRHLGAFYGFLTWCLALIISILLVDPIQHYLTFYSHFISGATVGGRPLSHSALTITANLPLPATKVIISTYILFCLFFLSAFASSLGGHCGMRYVNRDERSR